MSRKRGKKQKAASEAIPVDILAEGSGPVGRAEGDAITTVEDVVTTEDIETTENVVTADDVVVTAPDPERSARVDAGLSELAFDEPPLDDGNSISEATDGAAIEVASPDAGELDGAAEGGDAGGPDVEGGEDIEGGEGGEADEDDASLVFPTSASTMDVVQFKHLVEALIFASDRPLTIQRLRQLTRVGDVRRIEQALAEITEDYRERGLILQQVSGGYQFRTRTQFSAWVQQLIAGRPVRLSRAQLETLAIIAYRQPITRPEIDDIRGVDSTATLKLLIDRMLIRVLGKREEVGRPMLYGTTKEFLDFFSLGDLRELPTLREYSELTAESRKVMSDRLGIAPDGPDGDDGDGSGGAGNGGEGDGGDSGGGDGGDSGGGSGGGGGPIPGFEHDDGPAPASAMAGDLADALSSFFSAAEAVDSSNAAAVAESEGLEPVPVDPVDPVDDELPEDEAGDTPEVRHASEPAMPRSTDASYAHDESTELALAEPEAGDAPDISLVSNPAEPALYATALPTEPVAE